MLDSKLSNCTLQAMSNFINETYIERHGVEIAESSLTLIWSVIVALYCFGGIFGGLLTSVVSDRLGRKGGLLWNNVLVLLGGGLEALSKPSGSYEMICVGRFILGINSGLNAGLAPMYLSEISPVHLRGAIGTVYQLVLTISILVAQILGLSSLMGNDACWPWLLAVTILPGIFQIATLPLCPESPKYILLTQGREVETQNALTWLRGTIEVHDELDAMRAEYETMKAVPKVTLGDMITSDALRMPLIIACVIMLGQQFSGINAVFFFSVSIFQTAGLTDSAARYATIGVGIMNVAMTFVSLVLVEKAGRKTLLLIGFAGMLVNVVLLYLCLLFKDLGQWISYLSILWVILFVVMFAVGPGSIPWFLVTELFSQGGRPLATSIAVALNWTANSIIAVSFLPIEVSFTPGHNGHLLTSAFKFRRCNSYLILDSFQGAIGAHVFGIFALLLGTFIAFTWFKVPETKNKTVEEIAAIFRQRGYQQ